MTKRHYFQLSKYLLRYTRRKNNKWSAQGCRILADFLSRLTAVRLGAESSNQDGVYSTKIETCFVGKDAMLEIDACSCDSHDNSSLVEVRARPDKQVHCTLANTRPDKTSDKPRSCRRLVWILSTLADKWRFFCRPTKSQLVCGSLYARVSQVSRVQFNCAGSVLSWTAAGNQAFSVLATPILISFYGLNSNFPMNISDLFMW